MKEINAATINYTISIIFFKSKLWFWNFKSAAGVNTLPPVVDKRLYH